MIPQLKENVIQVAYVNELNVAVSAFTLQSGDPKIIQVIYSRLLLKEEKEKVAKKAKTVKL